MSKKRNSDHLGETGGGDKRAKTSKEVIELSDDSNEPKVVNEISPLNETGKMQENQQPKFAEKSNPLSLYLNKVNGIDNRFNNQFTLTIREILSKEFGNNLKQSCQFSYTFDIDWLVGQYAGEYRRLPLTIVAQQKPSTVEALRSKCEKYPNIELCFARLAGNLTCLHLEFDSDHDIASGNLPQASRMTIC